MALIETLIGLGVVLVLLYYYLTSGLDFWSKLGVNGPRPLPFFGNFKDVMLGRIHFSEIYKRYYDQYKNEPVIGIFMKEKPVLIIKDSNLVKDVLVKDFSAFPNRGVPSSNRKDDPFSQNLISLDHDKWRPLRNKLSPVFTSGKLKDMFYLILDCAKKFETYIEKLAAKGEPVECRELTAKFTTDVIGVCAFGLNTNSLDDGDSEFRKAGREMVEYSYSKYFRQLLRQWLPSVYNLLKPFIHVNSVETFIGTIKESIEYRKKNKVRRNDFVDLLLDLKDQPDKLSNFEFTDSLLISQVLIFFLAGFETSASTISNTMYELARNPKIQDKLREEIQETFSKDGKFTYENIKSMKYLDKVFKETLRKHPPGSLVQRKSVTSYTFNGTNVTIPKDTTIAIPLLAVHRDPDNFPNPELYDPERFSEENEKSINPMTYLPFGDGPHNCIGMRFANYQTKLGIATIINKFKLDVCDKTISTYKIATKSIIPTPLGGIYLKIAKL